MARSVLRWFAAAVVAVSMQVTATAQQAPEKSRVGVVEMSATSACRAAAKASRTEASLDTVLQGADGQFTANLVNTRKFDVVARSDLEKVIREQNLAESGLVAMDKQAAKSMALAGCRYIITVTVETFEDTTNEMSFEGQFGSEKGEKRTLQLSATAKIWDTTTGVALGASALRTKAGPMTGSLMAGESQQGGRKTDKLLADVTASLARDAVNSIVDTIYPAKVMAYTDDQITFNRTAETGVVKGQCWEVLHAGEAMIDPDTGEVLGAEETPIGWVEISEAGAKFAKAKVIADSGIQKGDILRHRPDGLPAGVVRTGPLPANRRPPAPAPRGPAQGDSGERPPAPLASGGTDPGTGPAQRTLKAAIFVANREGQTTPSALKPGIDDSRVATLEDYVTSAVNPTGLQIISRELCVNAVSRMASKGANAGTNAPGADEVERRLSDSTSAQALAANLNADVMLFITISSLDRKVKVLNEPSMPASEIATWTLRLSYKVVDGANGGTLDAGTLTPAPRSIRQSPGLASAEDPRDDLFLDAANLIGEKLRASIDRLRLAPRVEEVEVEVHVIMADVTIPEISKDPQSGEYVVGAGRHQLEASSAKVYFDGMLAGSAPGRFRVSPRVHKIRVEHPLLETSEDMMTVRSGMTLDIPMKLSVEGLERWKSNALFLDSLKDRQVLRDVALERAKAMTEFMRNSYVRIDTRNVTTMITGAVNIWEEGR